MNPLAHTVVGSLLLLRVREVLQKYSEMRLKGTIETVISKSVE